MSKITKFLHNLWYVEIDKPSIEECTNEKGIFNQEYYDLICEQFKESALEQQQRNRLAIIGGVIGFIFAILIFFYFFQILICIGLFFGCIGMLLKK